MGNAQPSAFRQEDPIYSYFMRYNSRAAASRGCETSWPWARASLQRGVVVKLCTPAASTLFPERQTKARHAEKPGRKGARRLLQGRPFRPSPPVPVCGPGLQRAKPEVGIPWLNPAAALPGPAQPSRPGFPGLEKQEGAAQVAPAPKAAEVGKEGAAWSATEASIR